MSFFFLSSFSLLSFSFLVHLSQLITHLLHFSSFALLLFFTSSKFVIAKSFLFSDFISTFGSVGNIQETVRKMVENKQQSLQHFF